ncbi:hypothetical protein MRB53_037213 [Persea americana]|nr:hypothetical protein MRB53_037213 [Persea americana]
MAGAMPEESQRRTEVPDLWQELRQCSCQESPYLYCKKAEHRNRSRRSPVWRASRQKHDVINFSRHAHAARRRIHTCTYEEHRNCP